MPGQCDNLPDPYDPMPGERADPVPDCDDQLPDPNHSVPGQYNHLSSHPDPMFECGNRLPNRSHSVRRTSHRLRPTTDDLPGSHQPHTVPKRRGGYHHLPNSTDQLSETGNILPSLRSDDLPGESGLKLWTHIQSTVADPVPTGDHPVPWNSDRVCRGADGVSADHHPMPDASTQLWTYHDTGHADRMFASSNDLPSRDHPMPNPARCLRGNYDAEHAHCVQPHANPMPGYHGPLPISNLGFR